MCLEKSQNADIWYGVEITVWYIVGIVVRNQVSYAGGGEVGLIVPFSPEAAVNCIMLSLVIYHGALTLATMPRVPYSEWIHKSYWAVKIFAVVYTNLILMNMGNHFLESVSDAFFWMGTAFLVFQTVLIVESACLINTKIKDAVKTFPRVGMVVVLTTGLSVFFNMAVMLFFAMEDQTKVQSWRAYLVMINLLFFFLTLGISISGGVIARSRYSGMFVPAFIGLYNAFQVFSMVRNSDGAGCDERDINIFDTVMNYLSTSFTVISMFFSGIFHGQDPNRYWLLHIIYAFLCAYCDQTLLNWDSTLMRYVCLDVGSMALYVKIICLIVSYLVYFISLKIPIEGGAERNEFIYTPTPSDAV